MEALGGIAVVAVGVAAFLGVLGKVTRDSRKIKEIEKEIGKK
jgi:hypothetical protein